MGLKQEKMSENGRQEFRKGVEGGIFQVVVIIHKRHEGPRGGRLRELRMYDNGYFGIVRHNEG